MTKWTKIAAGGVVALLIGIAVLVSWANKEPMYHGVRLRESQETCAMTLNYSAQRTGATGAQHHIESSSPGSLRRDGRRTHCVWILYAPLSGNFW